VADPGTFGQCLTLSGQGTLARNCPGKANPFFEALSDLFKTGPNLTNVMDLHILLVR
jgi:glycerate-2-kinase